ncbi:MAG: hypothetical protein JWO75_2419 [Actinomycetia bacterium]|jgi:hypothetical protein|nr:hypothetical protein [Actinomycetes bacterium]
MDRVTGPWALPGDGEAVVAGVRLPAGKRMAPALWATGDATAAPLTVVLRSWEERFGATVMHVGFDQLDLLLEGPVRSEQEALAVAAEHFAFCSDNVDQGVVSIREYAEELPGAARWSFWWD